MQYYDPYSPQISTLQQQLHTLQSAPKQITVNGGMSQADQRSGLQSQLSQLTKQQGQAYQPMQPIGTPDAMGKPTSFNPSMFANPFASMGPGFGTAQGYSLASPAAAQPSAMPIPSAQPGGPGGQPGGVGQYTNSITANIPQSAINTASAAAMKPVANHFSGTPGSQLGDYTRAAQSSGALDLRRQGAQSQAKMNLANQTANANSGLNWSDLLARLNEAATGAKNSVMQPLIGDVLSQLLQGSV